MIPVRRRIALMLSILLAWACAAPVFAQQPMSGADRAELIRRVEMLRQEADAILKLLDADGRVSAMSTTPSLTDLLTSMKQAVDDVDLLVIQAKEFLKTSETSVGHLGGRIDTEMQKISDRIVENLATMDATVDQLGGRVDTEMADISAEISASIKDLSSEITNLVTELRKLVQTATEATNAIGGRVDTELEKISAEIVKGLDEISTRIAALVAQVEAFVRTSGETVDQLGDRVDVEMHEISLQIQESLADLNVEVAKLVGSTSAFVEESTLVLRDIRLAAERTVDFVNRIDGRASVGVYADEDGIDSRIDVGLWMEPKVGQRYFTFLDIGMMDLDTTPRAEVLAGVARPPFSLGMGYIRQGVGVRLGYNDLMRKGFDAKIQTYRFDSPLVDAELGYTHPSGPRGFIYADDVFRRDDVELGGGLEFNLSF